MLSISDVRPSDRFYAKVQHAIPAIEWPAFATDIDAILALKKTRNAVILAHNYQTPEIYHCVADIVGDSLALARAAMQGEAHALVFAPPRLAPPPPTFAPDINHAIETKSTTLHTHHQIT